MEQLISFFSRNSFAIEYLISCFLFLLPLERRRHFALRITTAIVVQLLLDRVVIAIIALWGLRLPLAFFTAYIMGIVMFRFCAAISFWDAVFGATCSFALQHMSYAVYSFLTALLPMQSEVSAGAVEALIFLGITTVCYFWFAKKLPISGQYGVRITESIRAVIIVLPFAFFLSMLAENAHTADTAGNTALFLISRVYAVLCCVFVLWVQTSINERVSVETEYRVQKMLWHQQKDQYQLSKENIDIINRKCHDLKHQVAAIRAVQNESQRDRYLDEMEKSVMIYDSAVQTGNEVLNTILTERSLSCEKEGISWTCMADGKQLDFMDPVDLYTIFGNVLDNAIESVRKLKDPERRIVSVTLYSKRNMTVLQVENYFDHDVQFEDGLPVTSKGDTNYHGFGLKSIRSTVEKYGGSLSIDAQDHIFLLCIVLPTP